jgi:2-polyprenyl-3-methyl-5-hydroxy-6-metoxy-1,4-benzoquinol methylase
MKSEDTHGQDSEGQLTLEVISKADRFNRWMFKTIEPYCAGRILEAGSGIGNISKFFLEAGHSIALSDVRVNYVDHLKRTFSQHRQLIDIFQLDLVDPEFSKKFGSIKEGFDTFFSLNVIEHIENDQLALRNAMYLLRKGGKLVILVPAFPGLYNHFDRSLGHFRRYTRKSLIKIMEQQNLEIIHARYFNLAGILGWYGSGKLQKNKTIPSGQMDLYNRLVPAFRLLDKLTMNLAGLSVIAVGRK